MKLEPKISNGKIGLMQEELHSFQKWVTLNIGNIKKGPSTAALKKKSDYRQPHRLWQNLNHGRLHCIFTARSRYYGSCIV
jgi:hypothetical protein